MSNIQQKDMLSFYFNRSLSLEEMLIQKYGVYKKENQNKQLHPLMDDFKKNSKEHMKDLQQKMNRLGIQ